jgi:predicted membrane-bound mannosyltransferase
VVVTLYSSFFTHGRGVLDAVLTYGNYFGWVSGEKSRHIHPWYFYLQRLLWFHEDRGPVWSEALIVALAAAGMVVAWRRRRNRDASSPLPWFLAVYTLALTAEYSIIRHKSPWLMLSFLHGMILLAGVGAVALMEAVRPRWAKWLAGMVLAAAAWQLGGQTWRANGRFCADPRNPCVYAHTSPDLLNLVRRVEQIAALHPAHRDMLIEVCADPYDTWPLPWYFRKYRNVGYWIHAEDFPADPRSAIIITSMDPEPAVAKKLGENWQPALYAVRPMVFLTLRVQKDYWDKFIETRAKPKAP